MGRCCNNIGMRDDKIYLNNTKRLQYSYNNKSRKYFDQNSFIQIKQFDEV